MILILFTLFISAKTFTKIEFDGDVDIITGEFDRATLLKVCHIEYPPIYKFWKSDPTFESEQIDDFVENLENYAYSVGYYRAKINSKTHNNKIILYINIGEAIRVKSISMDNEFKRFALLEKGKRFRTKDFTQTKRKITRHLEENGYPTYKMEAKAFVNRDRPYQVDINISIDKGKKYYFGKTEVNNSSNMDDKLITEQIFYEEGELYDISKVEESYDNIYRLGVFEKIKVKADFNKSSEVAPLNIILKEGETKEFASMLGYDTDEGARGGAEYIDHNFFGNLREFKVGAKIAEKGYRAYTGFYDPRVIRPLIGDFSFRNELSYQNWEYNGYNEGLTVERVTLGKKFVNLDHFFGFQLEYNEIESDNGMILDGSYLINSLFYRLVIDKRDSLMDAKNGYYTSLYIEKAMKQLASEIDYLKILAEGRYIKQLEPMVFAIKVRLGRLSQETPVFKHFFAGGAMSNRGYEYRDLGLHYHGDAIGGVGLIDTSLEGRYYLSENFSVVGFMDSSTISQEVDKFEDDWYRSYGMGMRYLSIIGPLRFDIGFQEDGDFALHLGIGQVF
ncbi:BamA/TamA family outer membrane protein [Sulfurovum sp. bin170]|uniref:autotransporter assembly complex protein TamA n=1 Tax=Sulfurovum sp. bin170 TaxID=2695268 RepID=UPI0013DF6631|nr:BamA/TamA family outer membrane protein [Sulfurovum sp. bin170]NEW59983.1 BamA/TamA family outer membrane protein [Sulfurovum sp. bin170]